MHTWQRRATRSPDRREHLRINRRTVDSVTVFGLVGALDAGTAPAVQEQIGGILAGQEQMLLDVSDLGYVSSAGLRAMLMLHRRANQSGVALALVGASPRLLSILSATGFVRFFQVAANVEDGIAALRRPDLARPAHRPPARQSTDPTSPEGGHDVS